METLTPYALFVGLGLILSALYQQVLKPNLGNLAGVIIVIMIIALAAGIYSFYLRRNRTL